MIYRSPHPDVAIPDIAVAGFVLRNVLRLADKAAMIDAASGRTLSYRQIGEQVQMVAAGLAAAARLAAAASPALVAKPAREAIPPRDRGAAPARAGWKAGAR